MSTFRPSAHLALAMVALAGGLVLPMSRRREEEPSPLPPSPTPQPPPQLLRRTPESPRHEPDMELPPRDEGRDWVSSARYLPEDAPRSLGDEKGPRRLTRRERKALKAKGRG